VPDWVDRELVLTPEDLKRVYEVDTKKTEVNTFQELLTELTKQGGALIHDYYTTTNNYEAAQKEVYSIRAELKATQELLDSFSQGYILAPNVEDELKVLRAKVEMYEGDPENVYNKGSEETAEKIIEYLSEAVKKPGTKKTVLNKAIAWVKENFNK
jgi:chromosome segregation ATPase